MSDIQKPVFDYSSFRGIEKVTNTKFLIKHKNDSSQDIEVNIDVDEEGEKVYFDGLTKA